MKKLMTTMLLSLVLILGLTACGNDEEKKVDSSKDNEQTSTEENQDSSEDNGEKEVEEDVVKEPVTMVNSEDAKSLINDEGAVLVDVRTQDEYDAGHIDGAILVPLDELDSLIDEKIESKDQKIILYCRSGRRSSIAAELLVDRGYTAIYDLGAMSSWED